MENQGKQRWEYPELVKRQMNSGSFEQITSSWLIEKTGGLINHYGLKIHRMSCG